MAPTWQALMVMMCMSESVVGAASAHCDARTDVVILSSELASVAKDLTDPRARFVRSFASLRMTGVSFAYEIIVSVRLLRDQLRVISTSKRQETCPLGFASGVTPR